MSGTVWRLTKAREVEMAAGAAMVEMARDIMAGQATGDVPRVRLSVDGRITLTYADGSKVWYLTGADGGLRIERA